jgi:acyl-CoA thioester hydrolase
MHKTFSHNVKIYYEDTDSGGVVYYANYLKYFERARTEALITIGLSNLKIKDEFNSLIIVKSCKIEYKKSAYLEDNLTIKSLISSISKTSFVMDQSIYKDDLLIVDAKIHLVFVNEKGKPVKIPGLILEKFENYKSD